MRTILFAICFLALPALAADIYTFDVSGPLTVSGLGGVSVLTGWGYSIHNDSTSFWLVTTDLSAGTFQHATPELLFDFPDLAPGATVTVPYNPVLARGLYQIAWDANAPVGFVNSGTFRLTAEWWNGNPTGGGSLVDNAPNASQPYKATITPEPATIGLAAIFLSALFIVRFLWRGGTCPSESRQTPS